MNNADTEQTSTPASVPRKSLLGTFRIEMLFAATVVVAVPSSLIGAALIGFGQVPGRLFLPGIIAVAAPVVLASAAVILAMLLGSKRVHGFFCSGLVLGYFVAAASVWSVIR